MRKDRRRRFLLASSALVAMPLVSFAQHEEKVRRIGILYDGVEGISGLRRLLPASLRRLGYEEGRNLVLMWRFTELKTERLPALAEELMRLNVEVIVTWPNSATVAAMRASNTIPIVMFSGFLPVENRLVEALAHPGGNITGTTYWDGKDQFAKSFEILKDAMPRAKRLTVLWDRSIPEARLLDGHLSTAATALGLTLTNVGMTRYEELSAALDQINASRPDVLHLSSAAVFQRSYREIAAFALQRKLVSISGNPNYVNRGGLLSYAPDFRVMADRVASYVDRILRGAKPADLPIENPTKFELALNATTARAIGFNPPQSFMVRVDRQVE